MAILNIEIKACCSNPVRIRDILVNQNARFIGEDHQVDTYFVVNEGRLKLREGDIENSLIYYRRSNEAGPKRSDVLLYKTRKDSSLKDVLCGFLKPLVVVDKRREIFFIENVKFHIDRVKDLGSFVEIEAIDTDRSFSEKELRDQCTRFLELLEIEPMDLLADSYSDMLLAQLR